ncbi:beta strand repeat-containing protein, partial [Gilvimarinus algae]
YVLDGVGLDPAKGLYNFTGVTFNGDFNFAPGAGQVGELFFVAANATGSGSGANLNNIASVAAAQAQATSGDLTTFVFINDGNAVDFTALAGNTFTLSNGQVIAGFGNSAEYGLVVPANLIGNFGDVSFTDPTGNGAATLTSTGAPAITLADDNLIRDVSIGSATVSGNGFTDLTITGITASGNATHLFDFTNAAGTISITDSTFNLTGGLLNVDGGNASITISQGTGTALSATGLAVANTTGGNVTINDFTRVAAAGTAFTLDANAGAVTLNNLVVTRQAGDLVFAIDSTGPSSGDITLTGTASATSADGELLSIGAGARDIDLSALDYTGTVSGSDVLVDIAGQTGGTITLGNLTSTGSTGAGLVHSSGTTGGSLVLGDITASGFDSTGSWLVDLNDHTNVTLGALDLAALNGDVLSVNGSNLTTGNITQLTTQGGQALNLTDVALAGNFTVDSLTSTDSTSTGITLNGVGGANLTFTSASISGADVRSVSLVNANGTIDFGGLSSIFGTGGTALHIDGGNVGVTYSGAVTQNGGRLLNVVNTVGGSVTLSTGTFSNPGGTGINIANSAASVNVSGVVTLGTASMPLSDTAITINNSSGAVTVAGASIESGAGDTGLSITGGSGTVTVSGTMNHDDGGASVTISGGTRAVNLSGLAITNTNTATGNVIDVDGTASGAVDFGTVAITGASGTAAVDLTNSGAISFDDLDISGSGLVGLNASTLASLAIDAGTLNITNGLGVDINAAGAGSVVVLDSVTVNNSAGGAIDLTTNSGSYTFTTVDLTTTGGIGFNANNAGQLTVGGGSVSTTNARGVDFNAMAAGSNVTFGSVTVNNNAGGGVELTSNAGNYQFNGLSITNTNGTGFIADNSGNVGIAGATSSINSTTGTALFVNNTTILAGGLNLQSLSSSNTNHGIYLNNTGSGGLTVSGTGTTVGSGGTIANTSDSGIALIDARNINLNGMIINTTANHGISGSGVTAATPGSNGNAFRFANGRILNAGDSLEDNGIYFGEGLGANNIADQFTVDTVLFDNYFENGIYLENGSTNTDVDIINAQFQNAADAENDQAILINSLSGSSASFDVSITGSTFGTPVGSGTAGICCSGLNFNAQGSGTHNLVAQNNTFQNVSFASSGQGIVASTAQTASMTVNITNNNFIDLDAANVALSILDSSDMSGVINDNTFTGNTIHGNAIRIVGDGGPSQTGVFSGVFTIDNNTINADSRAIVVLSRDATDANARVHVNITNNNITGVASGGEVVELGSQDNASLCGNITGNTITETSGSIFDDIGILPNSTQSIQIAQASAAAISGANNGATVYEGSGGTITYNSSCLTP